MASTATLSAPPSILPLTDARGGVYRTARELRDLADRLDQEQRRRGQEGAPRDAPKGRSAAPAPVDLPPLSRPQKIDIGIFFGVGLLEKSNYPFECRQTSVVGETT